MHARRRGIAIVAVAGATVLGGTPAFSAQRESILPDVVRAFSEAALAELRQSEEADPSTTGLDDADAVIIEDGPNNASFTLDNGTVTALSGFAADLIPRPVLLAEAMPIISQAYAQLPSDLPSPARTALVVVGLLLIPAGLLVLIVVMRPRVTGL